MKFIGITGGVGAGKSEILHYLETKDGVKVMLADEIAHELMLPGTDCYQKLKDRFRNEDSPYSAAFPSAARRSMLRNDNPQAATSG